MDETARVEEYTARQEAMRLRRELYAGDRVDTAALDAAELALAQAEEKRRTAQAKDPHSGVLTHKTLGAATTGLETTVTLRMEHVPTAIAHLMTVDEHPLVEVTIKNTSDRSRRVRVTAVVDGISATAVDSRELAGKETSSFLFLPVLRPSALRDVTELTRAALNVLVEDLDSADSRVELHRAFPIWLLARSTAPLAVLDPKTGAWLDMTRYFGAFVTPNAPAVQAFLRSAAARHPDGRLVGYQGAPQQGVESQIKAMFDALKADAGVVYVNSVLTTSPREGFSDQRVRVPSETLRDRQANCIDGTVLYASLIEAASMSPALVIVPGHAFVAWETWRGSGEWAHLETTMTATHDFTTARDAAEQTAKRYALSGDLVRWPLVTLRTRYGITPME